MPENFWGQIYSELKKKAQKANSLFVDTVFKACDKSLCETAMKYGKITWLRPQEITKSPVLHVADYIGDDMTHGFYGSHAFLAACSCLATYKAYWNKVIPSIKEQEWDPLTPKKYAGIFHFLIWHKGEWLDLVVDDQLPTIGGRLVFCHAPDNGDFWLPLLEKAYAKLLGSYERLGEADMLEILEDFTGGLSEMSDINPDEDTQERLFRILKDEVDNRSLLSAVIAPPALHNVGKEKTEGLLMGHWYGVTAVKRVTLEGTELMEMLEVDKVNMIRLRDPWATKGWTGEFGRRSMEWNVCGSIVQKKLGIILDVDNEFWMKFEDFCANFTDVVMCQNMKNKSCSEMSSEWAEPNKAGGSIKHIATFFNNPQFILYVVDREDEVVICLMQTTTCTRHLDSSDVKSATLSQRSRRPVGSNQPTESSRLAKLSHTSVTSQPAELSELTGSNQPAKCTQTSVTSQMTKPSEPAEWKLQTRNLQLRVGFTILKVEENRIYRLHRNPSVVMTSPFDNTRRVILRQWLQKGRYIIVATTLEPHEVGTFILHIYTSVSSSGRELVMDKPMKRLLSSTCSCFPGLRHPIMLTQVIIVKATGLEQSKAESNLYCVITCEGQKIMTPVCKNTLTPEWNTGAIFYRRNVHECITVQLWTQDVLTHMFLGEVILDGRLEVDLKEMFWPLYDHKDITQRKPGALLIRLTVTSNLQGI